MVTPIQPAAAQAAAVQCTRQRAAPRADAACAAGQPPQRRVRHTALSKAAQPTSCPADAAAASRGQPRRALLACLLSAALGAALPAASQAAGGAGSSPYNDVLPEVGVLNGRLLSCPSTFNCVSTSSRSSDQYTSPWVAPVTTTKDAADAIIEAVGLACPQSELLTNEAQPSGQYLRFHVPGRFPLPDEVEFLVRNTGVSGRNFDADEGAGLTVTLRSIAGTVQYVYPFMTPVSDGGLQKSRLTAIREQLAWRLVGCELIECYQ